MEKGESDNAASRLLQVEDSGIPDDADALLDDDKLQFEEGDNSGGIISQNKLIDRIYSPVVLLILFTVIGFLNYMDRGAISGLMPAIQVPVYHIGDTEAGAVASVFTVGYMLTAPVFASMAKWFRPTKLVAFGSILWVCASFIEGMAPSYPILLLCRIASGVGEASFAGLAPTTIDDNAPPKRRTLWLALFYSAMPVGTAVGYATAGVFAGEWKWNLLFVMEAFLMLPFAIFAYFVPVSRSASNLELEKLKSQGLISREKGSAAAPMSLLSGLWSLILNPIYLFIVLGFAAQTFVLGSLAYWVPSYLKNVMGMPMELGNLVFGVVTALCGMFGVAGGGYVLDMMGGSAGIAGTGRSMKFAFILSFLSLPLGIILFAAIQDVRLMFVVLGFTEILIFATAGPINAAILSSVRPDLRSLAMAIAIFVIHLLGDFPSPVIVGFISTHTNLRTALSMLMLWLIWCLLFFFLAWFFCRVKSKKQKHDEAMNLALAETVAESDMETDAKQ